MENKKILIVDDNEDDIFLIRRVFRKSGILVSAMAAFTLVQARSMLQSHAPFDVITLDGMLPDGFGYTLIPEIRKHSPDVCIIMLSGQSIYVREGLRLGANKG